MPMPSDFVWSIFCGSSLARDVDHGRLLFGFIGTACGSDSTQLFKKMQVSKQVTLVSRLDSISFRNPKFLSRLDATDQLLAWLIWMGIG